LIHAAAASESTMGSVAYILFVVGLIALVLAEEEFARKRREEMRRLQSRIDRLEEQNKELRRSSKFGSTLDNGM
jgi:hypothetical protein